ncbi:MAG: phosphonate C-P lyase system protein PhnH [Piscinibacter sp.]|uniref:phosphonate C-P lyase system protein PhnH n=1 Tax=Piscinibacter sp. TaxID=1903157 RepID=UPI003D0E4517
MSAVLADLGRGFGQPVHDAQRVFRAVLEAMSRPGRVQALPAAVLDALETPGLGRATTAVLLALLDAETRVWLHPSLYSEAARAYLSFHTGVQHVDEAHRASFAVIEADHATPALWHELARGSDAVPQDGATLIVEVTSLDQGLALALRGPGVETVQTLRAGGLHAGFWQARRDLESAFPLGIELILTCGDRLAALPRSTRVSLEG